MRIIAGTCKGRRINAPKSIKARPTTDFAKEGLFNVLNNITTINKMKVLDLFAGTGNISYEFSSRGAEKVLAVDQQMSSFRFISEKAKELNLSIKCIKKDVFSFITKANDEKFNLIFADPPYNLFKLDTLPDLILQSTLLDSSGILIIEHGNENDFSSHPNLIDKRTYSRVNFSFFKHLPFK